MLAKANNKRDITCFVDHATQKITVIIVLRAGACWDFWICGTWVILLKDRYAGRNVAMPADQVQTTDKGD